MTAFPRCRTLFVLFLLAATGYSILIPSLECFIKFSILNFDLANFEQYDVYFRNESIMELAQTGQYTGPDGIEEYVRFGDPTSSPYFALALPDIQTTTSYDGYENGQCIFLVILHSQLSMDPNYTNSNITFRRMVMLKIFFDFEDNYISRINIFYQEEYLKAFFANFLDSDKTRQFICDTMTGSLCSDIIKTPKNCLETLRALPGTGERSRLDGNSQGCRALHAVFASMNDAHCPHISFTPQSDIHGKIKCQTEGKTQPKDLFTPNDFTKFSKAIQANGFDPETGIKIVSSTSTKTPPCGVLGLGIMCFKGCGVFRKFMGLCTTT